MGSPLLPARTSLAWSGNASPSAATSLPASLSSLLKACMNAMFACRSCFGHLAYQSNPAFVADIIRMYFMSFRPFRLWHRIGAFHGVVGSNPGFSTSAETSLAPGEKCSRRGGSAGIAHAQPASQRQQPVGGGAQHRPAAGDDQGVAPAVAPQGNEAQE